MNTGEIAIYQAPDGTASIDVKLEKESVWLNRQQMAELFDRDIKTVGKHIGNALKEELKDFSVVAKFAPTATDGKTYQVEHYTLEMSNTINSQAKLKQNPHLTRLIYIKH